MLVILITALSLYDEKIILKIVRFALLQAVFVNFVKIYG
jgi:hypothetical protein